MEPRVKNWKSFPPRGGWQVTWAEKGQNFPVSALNPDSIVNQIAIIQKRNGTFKGRQPIWDWCNNIWCRRDPARCGAAHAVMQESVRIPADNTSATPAEYGSKLWGMLDTFGMKGAFHEKTWASAIAHISRILNPGTNPETGCSNCHNEWVAILKESPPTQVTNSKDAARWIFETHNRVNRKAGKPQYRWEKAVIKNKWET